MIGATQNSHSCESAQSPTISAGPVLRAGLTEVLVTGMLMRWIRVNADKEDGDVEKEIDEEMNEQDRPVVKKDYYFDEAMDVTLDYLLSRMQPVLGAKLPAPPVP